MFPKREIIVIANDVTLSIGNIAKLLASSGSLCNLVYLDDLMAVEGAYEYDGGRQGYLQGYLGDVVDPVYHRVVVERHDRTDFDVMDLRSNGGGSAGGGESVGGGESGTSSSSSSSSATVSYTHLTLPTKRIV